MTHPTLAALAVKAVAVGAVVDRVEAERNAWLRLLELLTPVMDGRDITIAEAADGMTTEQRHRFVRLVGAIGPITHSQENP